MRYEIEDVLAEACIGRLVYGKGLAMAASTRYALMPVEGMSADAFERYETMAFQLYQQGYLSYDDKSHSLIPTEKGFAMNEKNKKAAGGGVPDTVRRTTATRRKRA